MFRSIATGVSGAVLLAAIAGSAHAQFNPNVIGDKIHHWEWTEPDDTPLTGTMDSIGTTLNSMWSFDLGYNPGTDIHTATVQDGAFLVQRPGAGHYINSFAPIDPIALESNKLYLVADITWDYLNSTSGADMRFGFHNATTTEDTTSPNPSVAFPNPPVTILAEIVVRRVAFGNVEIIPGQPVIGAWGSAEDGTITVSASDDSISGTGFTPIGAEVQPDLVRVVLEIDQVERWGAVHWTDDGGASYDTLGGLGHTFPLNSTWNPNFVRLGALNNFVSGEGDGLRVEDLFVALPADVVDPPTLLGDFNNDGRVDAADYTVWRDNIGQPGLPNDNNLGTVGQDHYNLWKTNFGTEGVFLGAASAVPEPTSLLLCLLAALGLLATRRGR